MPIKAKRRPKKRATGFMLEIREYKSFEEADQADREFWWNKRPTERLREMFLVKDLDDLENPPQSSTTRKKRRPK